MATSLLALLDDITTILDDVATMTKVATKKTAGVLGDDLALNAQQVTGIRRRSRIARRLGGREGLAGQQGDPGAGGAGDQRPRAVGDRAAADDRRPLPVLRGRREVAHKFLHSAEEDEHRRKLTEAVVDPNIDLVALEKDRIKGAIRTDFILSAEIIVISLGTVANATTDMRMAVLVGIALLMTVGVYGLVAGIVKLDDGALALRRTRSAASAGSGAPSSPPRPG